jgi:hypothetical protein
MTPDRNKNLRCPVCGVNLRPKNYQTHLRRIHYVNEENIYSNNILNKKSNSEIEAIKELLSGGQVHIQKTGKKKKRKVEPKIVMMEQRQEITGARRRQLEIEAEKRMQSKRDREELIRQNAVTYNVIWEDIVFDKNKIRFSAQRLQAILHSAELEGSISELNTIKKEYFERKHGNIFFKLAFHNSSLVDWLSPGWDNLKQYIEQGRKYFDYPTPKESTFSGRSLGYVDFLREYHSHLSRNSYLKILAAKHHKDFAVMCIEEMKISSVEETFLFRTYDKGKNIVIFWESVNAKRATHIFKCDRGEYEERFQKIQSFIKTPMAIKRLRLHQSDRGSLSLKADLGYWNGLQHRDLESYSSSIIECIDKKN